MKIGFDRELLCVHDCPTHVVFCGVKHGSCAITDVIADVCVAWSTGVAAFLSVLAVSKHPFSSPFNSFLAFSQNGWVENGCIANGSWGVKGLGRDIMFGRF
jgi:hypothetical protein